MHKMIKKWQVVCLMALLILKSFWADAAPEVRFQGERILLNEQPFRIRGGEIHPQRVPREYWQHRLRMMKAMGLNTASSYFFWNDFERADGSFDFSSGNRDVAAFLRLCQDEGLKVLFRPGPYCCGEWDYGGLPIRMLTKPGYIIRSTENPEYLEECEKYLKAIGEVARPFLWQNGGPIILTQIENEYGSWRSDHRTKTLITWTKDFWKREGFGPFYMADGAGTNFYCNLPYPDREIATGMDPGMNEDSWNLARTANPGVPIFSSETYPGWLRHWGEGNWRPSDITVNVQWYVKSRKSFCLYVVHGGTSFGFTSGANDGGKGYEPDMTSYDYGAPITEQGLATPDYYRYRKILAQEVGGEANLPKVPSPIPTTDIAAFTPTFFAPLTANCESPFKSERCVHFESFGQNQGIVIYEAEIPSGDAAELRFERLADYAKVLVDGCLVATLDRRLGERSCRLPGRGKTAALTVICEAMGHINFGLGMEDDRKGIFGKATLGDRELTGWRLTPKPLTEASILAARRQMPVEGLPGGHFRGIFVVEKVADTFLNLSKWSKGVVYVNGHNLGRYWKIGPQYSLYCPAPFLKVGENQIDVIEMDLLVPQPICGTSQAVVRKDKIETRNANNVW